MCPGRPDLRATYCYRIQTPRDLSATIIFKAPVTPDRAILKSCD
jgi:hypothetical protein